jgi:hypothetical protein
VRHGTNVALTSRNAGECRETAAALDAWDRSRTTIGLRVGSNKLRDDMPAEAAILAASR